LTLFFFNLIDESYLPDRGAPEYNPYDNFPPFIDHAGTMVLHCNILRQQHNNGDQLVRIINHTQAMQ
jgi:hypothetical protein